MEIRLNIEKFTRLGEQECIEKPEDLPETDLQKIVFAYRLGPDAFDGLPLEMLLSVLHGGENQMKDAAQILRFIPDKMLRDRIDHLRPMKIQRKKRF
jgi:hypothetical protein